MSIISLSLPLMQNPPQPCNEHDFSHRIQGAARERTGKYKRSSKSRKQEQEAGAGG